jgi:hypothetical protein
MGRTGRMAMKSLVAFAVVLILAIVPAFLYGAEKGEALLERYRAAHEAGDVEALKALVCWEGGSNRTREILEQRQILHLNLEIDNNELRPLTGDEEFEKLGYRPNLQPAGWLVISFKPPRGDSRFLGKSFVVGEKNDEYLITVAAPTR